MLGTILTNRQQNLSVISNDSQKHGWMFHELRIAHKNRRGVQDGVQVRPPPKISNSHFCPDFRSFFWDKSAPVSWFSFCPTNFCTETNHIGGLTRRQRKNERMISVWNHRNTPEKKGYWESQKNGYIVAFFFRPIKNAQNDPETKEYDSMQLNHHNCNTFRTFRWPYGIFLSFFTILSRTGFILSGKREIFTKYPFCGHTNRSAAWEVGVAPAVIIIKALLNIQIQKHKVKTQIFALRGNLIFALVHPRLPGFICRVFLNRPRLPGIFGKNRQICRVFSSMIHIWR